jgi:hypothetical protein
LLLRFAHEICRRLCRSGREFCFHGDVYKPDGELCCRRSRHANENATLDDRTPGRFPAGPPGFVPAGRGCPSALQATPTSRISSLTRPRNGTRGKITLSRGSKATLAGPYTAPRAGATFAVSIPDTDFGASGSRIRVARRSSSDEAHHAFHAPRAIAAHAPRAIAAPIAVAAFSNATNLAYSEFSSC